MSSYDPAAGTYTLPPEQTVALTDENSPAYLPGFFQIALGSVIDSPRIVESARNGDGVGWHEHNHDVFDGTERFFRPGYNANLMPAWLPALTGVDHQARAGREGRGRRLRTWMPPRFSWLRPTHGRRSSAPTTTQGSIDTARERAAAAGVSDRVRFDALAAADIRAEGYDLVTMFDCLHDMGDPVGAAKHVRQAIADDGTWMIVEPKAGDRVEDNLNPVGRAYYGFSTLLCTPASLSQEVGLALGAQAGPARIRDVVSAGGFTRFRIAAETPFNLVYEARP